MTTPEEKGAALTYFSWFYDFFLFLGIPKHGKTQEGSNLKEKIVTDQ